jgi:membrane associated rhomboid family serine protease
MFLRRELYIPFLGEKISYDSWYAIATLLVLELFMFWRTGGAKYDHINHIAGLATGMFYGRMLRPEDNSKTIEPRVEYKAQVAKTG